jgi:BioD-like phosphotransacetylase family protein
MPSIIISSISEASGKSAIASAIISRLRYDGAQVLSAVDTGNLFSDDDAVKSVSTDEVEVSSAEIAVIEGSGGDMDADLALAEKLDSSVVLLAGLDEDVRTVAERYGERLAAVVFNKVPRYRNMDADRTVEELVADGMNCLGWLPEDRRLVANTVQEVIEHLDGRLAFDVDTTSELIDNILIGGLVLDWGPFYFMSQENICVVVRSGRPDVQISALQSDTTRALVLTGGSKPIDYVFYEARAKRIPLIVVEDDTDGAMNALDAMSPPSFAHSEKLARISQLLTEREFVDPILDLVAQPVTR